MILCEMIRNDQPGGSGSGVNGPQNPQQCLDRGSPELSREGAAESGQDDNRTRTHCFWGVAEIVEPANTARFSTRGVGWTTLPGSRELRMGREWLETQKTPQQPKSEAWQAGPEEKFLQHPSKKGHKWRVQKMRELPSCLSKTESDPDGPRGQMTERMVLPLMRAWHPGADVPRRGPT